MGSAPKLIPSKKAEDSPFSRLRGDNSREHVDATITNELVIAICGHIGSPTKIIADAVDAEFRRRDYNVNRYKISKYIEEEIPPERLSSLESFERKKILIEEGNRIRRTHGPDYFAEKVISRVFELRKKRKGESSTQRYESLRECYIIDSLKNRSELELLKKVYHKSFYMIGVFSDTEERLIILNPKGKLNFEGEAKRLISQDFDEDLDYGQSVKDIFPRSDFFIHSQNPKTFGRKISRFADAIFRTNIVTPTVQERAMYAAWAAGNNSACLSRQVGASVTDESGSLIGVGWNDVPKFGGGVYGDEDGEQDKRCFIHKSGTMHCRNDERKSFIISEIKQKLLESETIISGKEYKIEQILRKSPLKDLIEYSRSVHAEMHALFSALKSGQNRVIGGKVFVTTYPCHNCARHIVMAGIHEVYFIEPYPKSLAVELHGDSLTEKDDRTRVQLKPFEGIAPNRYLEIFSDSDRDRKQHGIFNQRSIQSTPHPHGISFEALYLLEEEVSAHHLKKLENS